jgi:hypothetical protein
VENIRIRHLRTTDADDIAEIYGSIVREPVDKDFKALIQKHARSENDICIVADLDDRVIGFMISYILTFGFGIEKSAWIATLGWIRYTWARESAIAWPGKFLNFIKTWESVGSTPPCAGIPATCSLFSKPWVLTAAISST